MKRVRLNRFILLSVLCIFFSFLVYLFMPSRAAEDISLYEIEENDELIYYIDVYYDGKDVNGISSSNGLVADIYSDYIYVEDKLPEGLVFNGFVLPAVNTFMATQTNDITKSCVSGEIVGCLEGFKEDGSGDTCLKYDPISRVASFAANKLQAGCKISVGIRTQVSTLGNFKRLDFYNTAYARERFHSSKSNTVHAFIGSLDEALYTVSYSYIGNVPSNAPELPTTSAHSVGATVGVENDMFLEGYNFSGWRSSDVTNSNGSFVMPQANVVFVGSFEPKVTYNVTYEISSIDIPKGYIVPKTKNYGIGDDVYVDSLSLGDVINGYRFLGWETENVSVIDGSFKMPEENVKFVGKFEKIKYSVSYAFEGSILPTNVDNILKEINSNTEFVGPFAPGDKVSIANIPLADNYKFLGWYSDSTFEMPEENVVIYGEWEAAAGKFSPSVSISLVDDVTHYSSGDTVKFAITVKNTSNSFAIKDIMLQEMMEGVEFTGTADSSYIVYNDIYAVIPNIGPSDSVMVYAEYKLPQLTDVVKKYKNIVKLINASTDSGYQLDNSIDYLASITFKATNISLMINNIFVNDDGSSEKLIGSEFKLYTDSNLEHEVVQDHKLDNFTFNKLNSDTTYYLKQTKVAHGYVMFNDILKVDVSGDGEISVEILNSDKKTSKVDVTNNNGIATVSIINEKIDILPNTGGIGIIPFVLIGLIIICCSFIIFIYYIVKKSSKNKKVKKR